MACVASQGAPGAGHSGAGGGLPSQGGPRGAGEDGLARARPGSSRDMLSDRTSRFH